MYTNTYMYRKRKIYINKYLHIHTSKDYSDRQRTAVCIDAVPLPVCRHWPSGGLLIGYLSVH